MLVPAHPGNKNAQKAGVYSPRTRASRAAEIEAETEGVSARELRLGILRHELSSLLALSEAQDQALADEGVQGRRGQARSLVDQRLRTHDKLLRLARELEETQPGIPATTAAEERPTPPLNPEPLAQLVAEIHHESRIEDITPSDFSADAFLRAVVATQDPAVLLKNRATARRLLTKRRKNRPWSCTCFATRSASRDDLELQDWIKRHGRPLVQPLWTRNSLQSCGSSSRENDRLNGTTTSTASQRSTPFLPRRPRGWQIPLPTQAEGTRWWTMLRSTRLGSATGRGCTRG